MKSIPGCGLTHLTTYNHVPTALHIGFRNRPDIVAKNNSFDIQITPQSDATPGHGMIYNFNGQEIVSNAFVETRKEVAIPFLNYCLFEETLCSLYHHETPRVRAQAELQQEIDTHNTNSGMPALVSTYRLFNPVNKPAAGNSFLCNLTDVETLAGLGLDTDLAATLHGLSQNQGETMYITHAIALRSVQYNPKDQDPVVMPENYDRQPSGWTTYVMGERMFSDGAVEGHAYPVCFNTGFRKTLRNLRQIENAFIMPKIDSRSHALNERDAIFHHRSFNARALQIEIAVQAASHCGGQLPSAFKLG